VARPHTRSTLAINGCDRCAPHKAKRSWGLVQSCLRLEIKRSFRGFLVTLPASLREGENVAARFLGAPAGALPKEWQRMAAGLAPVALVPDLAAALGAPLARDPDGSGMGWFSVASADPDIAMAIPAVIAGNPYPATMWGRRNNLHWTRRGRPDTNHDLCMGGARSQDDGGDGCEKTSLQIHTFLLAVLEF
jgi:hypothetical protein